MLVACMVETLPASTAAKDIQYTMMGVPLCVGCVWKSVAAVAGMTCTVGLELRS